MRARIFMFTIMVTSEKPNTGTGALSPSHSILYAAERDTCVCYMSDVTYSYIAVHITYI